MDIKNLDAFKPRTKVMDQVEVVKDVEVVKIEPTPELLEPDPIYQEPSIPSTLPVIDQYVYSRNCSEYIKFEISPNRVDILNGIEAMLRIKEKEYRKYLASIKNAFKVLPIELVPIYIETKSFIVADTLWPGFNTDIIGGSDLVTDNLILEYSDKLRLDNIRTFKIIKTAPSNIRSGHSTIKPYYNHNYCNECVYTKICQRRALEKN
jgi:hypothetical protein